MASHFASGTIGLSIELEGSANLDYRPSATSYSAFALTGYLAASPRLLSVVALNSRKLRATYDQGMAKDSLLTSIGNYDVLPMESGAAGIYTESVEAEAVDFPSYVDINISEMTGDKGYRLSINSGSGAPSSKNGQPLNAEASAFDFAGVGLAPQISLVSAVGPNRVDVKFTEPMLDNGAIRNVANYVFDNGLIVTSVLEVEKDTVKLATTTQVSGLLYTLTIQ
jgi:hypothetical protein